METKANYVIVGSFVLALVAALFVFVVWLAKLQSSAGHAYYRIYFTGSVTGLQDGSLVRYRGIPVGTVTALRIGPENVGEIEVTIDVQQNTPVREDSVASLEVQGLTGVAYILLSGGTEGSPPVVPKPGKKYGVINARSSELEKVFAAAPQLVERAARVLSDANIKSIDELLANIATATAAIAGKHDEIATMIDDAAGAAHSLRGTSATVADAVKSLQHDADDTLRSIKRLADNTDERSAEIARQLKPAAESLDQLAAQLNGVVSENRRPLRDFSEQGLYEFTRFVTEARTMVSAITRVVHKIEADPARFFLGDQQQGAPAK